MCNDCKRSLITAFSKNIILAKEQIATLNNLQTKQGKSICFAPGNTAISLIHPGMYFVQINADMFSSLEKGPVILELLNNNEKIPGAVGSTSFIGEENLRNISFSTIVEVKPSCQAIDNRARLSILNNGVPTTFSNLNINIFKLS